MTLSPSASTGSLEALTDTELSSPAGGDVLTWVAPANGQPGYWTNTTAATGAFTIQNVTSDAYVASASDANTWICQTSSGGGSFTIPYDNVLSFPIGTVFYVEQAGAGAITVSAYQFDNPGANVYTRAQYSVMRLVKVAANLWHIDGDTHS